MTGNYLEITQPSALYLIKSRLGDRVDLRFYNEKNRSFHSKSYMFHYRDYSELYIGSSNISKSALTSGIEWNYRFNSKKDSKNYNKFFEAFQELFAHHSIVIDDVELKKYSKSWHRPAVAKDMELFTYMEDDIYELAVTHTKENPFKRYLSYRRRLKELTADEETFYQNENGKEFIKLLENTSMSKVYKMPVLMAFYNEREMCRKFLKNSF